MGKPRRKGRKAAYFILVLLILLVVAIIGGLSAVLFNMKPAQPRRPSTVAKTERVMLTNTVGNVTPTADVHIEIPPEQTPKPRVEEPSADGGIIPTVCDGYGP
ncbi:MAG: hypothetical protein HN341_15140, partial [Verrucomicrobia bacterium]|nr:hypothetical protein [Verrucomicrobiota bacterium]